MDTPSTDSLPRLELICFGPPTARVNGAAPSADVLWRKHLALLIYLALSPNRTRTRDHLLGLLWPEKAQEKARHSLNEAVRRLRTGLGPERIISDRDTLILNTTALDVDALRLDELAAHDVQRATHLLRGDFLEGFTVDDSPAFEDWASERRNHYRSVGASLWIRDGEQALAANQFGVAQDAAREALTLLPTSEAAEHLSMRAAALSGDATRALASFHTFGDRLARELDEEPSRELVALAERIRSKRWRRASGRYLVTEPPLISHPGVHGEALALVEQGLRSGARTLVIAGDPGHGKTRLLNECVERLLLAGACVALARPLESDLDAQWSALRQLIRAGLADAPGLAAAEPDALGVLASLAPELAHRFAPVGPKDTGHIAAALATTLHAVADEQPFCLALDDAHYADGSTIETLREAVRQLRSEAVMLIVAVDNSVDNVPRELVLLRSEVGRSLPGASVRLEPLTEAEIRQLVDRLAGWCADPDDRDRLARRIIFESQGSPFLAVTLLRDLERTTTLRENLLSWPPPRETYESPLPIVPTPVRMAILARVAALDEEAQEILRVASIGGLALDIPLIAALADVPSGQVEEIVERLEQARFVTHDGERFAFVAPLLAGVVGTDCLTRGQRKRLRTRAIEALGSRRDLESRVLRAELRSKTDPGQDTLEEAIAVTQDAIAEGSARAARRALHAVRRTTREGGLDASEAIGELQTQLEHWGAQGAAPSFPPHRGRLGPRTSG